MDDWPVFNEGENINLVTEGRKPITQFVEQANPDRIRWRATLGSDCLDLELGWYQKNTPLKPCYSLSERPGYVRIHGACYDLSSPEAPALLLRKQESYYDEFCAEMDFRPSHKGYEAGVTVWWNMFSYASIGVTAADVDSRIVRTVVCRHPTGTAAKMETTFPLLLKDEAAINEHTIDDSAPVQIFAKASPTTYTLNLRQRSTVASFSFSAESLTVMPPVGAAFTGAMFGIYSFGCWEPVLDPADFSNIYIKDHQS